jgi:hypothetical protein
MATVFFNGIGLHVLDVLPHNQQMDAEDFAEQILPSLASIFVQMEGNFDGENVLFVLTMLQYAIQKWSLTNLWKESRKECRTRHIALIYRLAISSSSVTSKTNPLTNNKRRPKNCL